VAGPPAPSSAPTIVGRSKTVIGDTRHPSVVA